MGNTRRKSKAKGKSKSKFQREHKDRLFKAVFGRNTEESKRWRLELYNALNGTNLTDPDELKVNTIENIIYITMKNDISFLVDDQMVLYEQQSTFNQNMPLRGFFYFAQLYQKFLAKRKLNINGSGKVGIPTPRFFVFYNGTADKDGFFKMRLSDSFLTPDKSGDFEWTASVININEKRLSPLHKKCVPLYDYSRFIAKVRESAKGKAPKSEDVEAAVDWAIKENLLEGFFERQKAEVMGFILTEFNQETYEKNVREDGYREGLEDGMRQKAVENATNMLNEGDSPEKVARCTGLPLEQVQELADKLALAPTPQP